MSGTVLVAEDDDALRALVVHWLSAAGLQCMEASDGHDAVARARAHAEELDAIVCDVMMPGLDGFEVLRLLAAEESTRTIPVVILTARATEESDVVRGAGIGAADHLMKPVSGPLLVAKVTAACGRGREVRELRTKLRAAEEHATIDPLTGLFNRRQFEDRLRAEAAYASRHERPFAVVMLDVDHFKAVNDVFGHAEGDRVLRHVADAVRAVLRADDMPFRYGGEEFVLILRGCTAEAAVLVVQRLRERLAGDRIALGPEAVQRAITFSAGVASGEDANAFDTTDLVTRADAALYRAKAGGRDRTEREPA